MTLFENVVVSGYLNKEKSAAEALKDNNYVRYVGYVLEDATQGETIAEQLNEKAVGRNIQL